MKLQKGFTLIETIIYVGLLAIIMGGSLLAAYQITQSSDALARHDAAGMEGDFVVRKLEWALGGASAITAPNSVTPQGTTLSVTRYDDTVVSVRYNVAANDIEVSEGSAWEPLTTNEVTNPQAQFTYITGPDGVAGVQATITLSDKQFVLKKYLQK